MRGLAGYSRFLRGQLLLAYTAIAQTMVNEDASL